MNPPKLWILGGARFVTDPDLEDAREVLLAQAAENQEKGITLGVGLWAICNCPITRVPPAPIIKNF